MNTLRLTAHVAWWEFRRCWRVQDLVLSLVIPVVAAFGWLGIQKALAWNSAAAVTRVAVMQHGVDLPNELLPDFELSHADGRSEEALRSLVDAGELDGLLWIDDPGRGRLYLTRTRDWVETLRAALGEAGRREKLRQSGLATEVFAQLMEPFELEVTAAAAARQQVERRESIAAGIFVALMLVAVLTGNSYLFLYITGEKQQRVTEQVVAILSPQTWIDGKIAGLALLALSSLFTMVIGMLIWNTTLGFFDQGFDLSLSVIGPLLLGQLVVLSVLGFLLWFAFFAAIAATIDDPNTSTRSLFLFLPLLPLSVAFGCLKNPDTALMQFFGLFPLTAPTVLPARLVLADVAAWEVPLAIVLLIITIALLRRAAGKLFACGILMYGREPRWRDLLATLRNA